MVPQLWRFLQASGRVLMHVFGVRARKNRKGTATSRLSISQHLTLSERTLLQSIYTDQLARSCYGIPGWGTWQVQTCAIGFVWLYFTTTTQKQAMDNIQQTCGKTGPPRSRPLLHTCQNLSAADEQANFDKTHIEYAIRIANTTVFIGLHLWLLRLPPYLLLHLLPTRAFCSLSPWPYLVSCLCLCLPLHPRPSLELDLTGCQLEVEHSG